MAESGAGAAQKKSAEGVSDRKRSSGKGGSSAPKAAEPRSARSPGGATGAVKQDTPPGRSKNESQQRQPTTAPAEAASTAATEPPAAAAWSDAEIVAALRSCTTLLAPIVAEVDPLPPVRAAECGAAAPVAVSAVGAEPRVEIRPPATLNCMMAGRLYRWIEEVVQPAARDLLGAPVVKLLKVSGYQCRSRIGGGLAASQGGGPATTEDGGSVVKTSEHAFANAIDIGGFELANGRRVYVSADWGLTARDILAAQRQDSASAGAGEQAAVAPNPPTKQKAGPSETEPASNRARGRNEAQAEAQARSRAADRANRAETVASSRSAAGGSGGGEGRGEPPAPSSAARELTREALFLRRLHKGACGPFGTVLGPEANDAHRDHLHLDLAPRKRSSYCE